MRLGGFVIHGNNLDTLGACLASLKAVCDEVVAVDSCSTDGSAQLVDSAGVPRALHPWRGYGSARARAMELLPPACDYVLYLDSDESLPPQSIEAIRAVKALAAPAQAYALPRRDWAELPGHRFLFRSEWRKRLMRREVARWTDTMIVHEALPGGPTVRIDAPIDHRFATSIARRIEKEDRYALLWAIRANAEGQRLKHPAPQRVAHFVRNAMVKGAVARGGSDGLRLAWEVAAYHQRKYEYLRAVRQGAFDAQRRAFEQGAFERLFAELPSGDALRVHR